MVVIAALVLLVFVVAAVISYLTKPKDWAAGAKFAGRIQRLPAATIVARAHAWNRARTVHGTEADPPPPRPTAGIPPW